jgi:hypothetical protein
MGSAVARLVFGAWVGTIGRVSEIPRLAGLDELAAARLGTADGARGDLLRPVLAQLAMLGTVAALGGGATLGVVAFVATPRCVAGAGATARAARSEAGSRASAHGFNDMRLAP